MLTKTADAASRFENIVTVIVTTTALAFFIVVARLWIKLRMTKASLWWDDFCAVMALLESFGLGAVNMGQMLYGFGYHVYDLSSDVDVSKGIYLFYWGQIFYFSVVGWVKLSILLFLLRLLPNLRMTIIAVMIFVAGTHIGCTAAAALQCFPIRAVWQLELQETGEGHCFNRTAFFYSNAALNIVSDVIIYVLPMKTMWSVHLPLKQRLGLILCFAVGGFVVITGLLRLHSLRKTSVTKDPTWDDVAACLWSEVEVNIGIICGSLPLMKPLFMKVLGLVWKGDSGSTAVSNGGNTGNGEKSLNRFNASRQSRSGWTNMPSNDDSSGNIGLDTVDVGNYEAKVSGNSEGMSGTDYHLKDMRELTPEGRIYKKTEVTVTAV